MQLRTDELDRIAIDRFTSTSGKYEGVLAERFEPHHDKRKGFNVLKVYDVMILDAATHRVVKVVRVAVDNQELAYLAWEEIKEKYTAKPDYEDETNEPGTLVNTVGRVMHYLDNPKFTTEEKEDMLRFKPRGARLFVRDIVPIDEVTRKAQDAGLHVIVNEEHKPKPTTGIVMAVGEDPLAQELYKVGMIVMFSKHAGGTFSDDMEQYRSIEIHEVIGVRESLPEEQSDLAASGTTARIPASTAQKLP